MLSTVVAAPTSTGSWDSDFHPEIEVAGRRTKVLVEQMQAVDVQRRLGARIGRVRPEEQAAIDRALLLVLGLF